MQGRAVAKAAALRKLIHTLNVILTGTRGGHFRTCQVDSQFTERRGAHRRHDVAGGSRITDVRVVLRVLAESNDGANRPVQE